MNLKKLVNLLPEFLRFPLIRSKINLGQGAPAHIIIKIAETKEELEQAFNILHDAYVEEGLMDTSGSGLRMTKYHALPSTAVLIAKDILKNRVVATLSLVRNSPLGLPLDSVCDLQALKNKYPSLTEVSSLAIDKEYRKDPTHVFWPLMRGLYRYARDVMGVEASVIGVHPKRHDLYKGILGYKELENSSEQQYSFVKGAPVVAYFADLNEQTQWYAKKYSHFSLTANWHQYTVQAELSSNQYDFVSGQYYGVQKPVMNSELFNYFFQTKTENVQTLNTTEKFIIENHLSIKKRFVIDKNSNVFPLRKYRKSERMHARLQGQIFSDAQMQNPMDVTILNLSASGVGIKSESIVSLPAKLFMRVKVGTYSESVMEIQPRSQKNDVYGCEILTSDAVWANFIDSLSSGSKVTQQANVG